MKFIYLCAAILVLSFTAMPMFNGISKERNIILTSNEATPQEKSLSFEEIYEIAAEGQENVQPGAFDPASLNAITPAAGQERDNFSAGFSGISDTALTDAPTSPLEN